MNGVLLAWTVIYFLIHIAVYLFVLTNLFKFLKFLFRKGGEANASCTAAGNKN